MKNEQETQNQSKPLTVLDGFMQPGFPAKVFTCFFLNDCLVFVKTGSFSTDTAGIMRGALGGYTGDGMITGALGSVFDYHNRQSRSANAAEVAGLNPEHMVAAHKRNFMLPYNEIIRIEMKGPNFAGEVKVLVEAGKTHKFRIDNQSKTSIVYYQRIINEFLPGKLVKK